MPVSPTPEARRAGPRFWRRPFDVVLGVIGLIVLVACGQQADSGVVESWEADVFHAINDLPGWLYGPLWPFQQAGNLLVGPAVAAIAAAFRRWRLAVAALLATVLKLGLERVVKQVVERDRPGSTVEDAILRGDVSPTGLSFVSGHAVLVTALAVIVTPYLRGRWKLVPPVVVLLVLLTRVYVGAHNPLDVVGGAGLGLFIGAVCNLVVGVPTPETAEPAR